MKLKAFICVLIAGIALAMLVWAPNSVPSGYAAPVVAEITGTPTEPPSPTPAGPTATPGGPTPTAPTPTLQPGEPTPTPPSGQPTATPRPPDDDDDDPDPTNTPEPTATPLPPAAAPPDLAVVKTASSGTARPGEEVDFTITVTNQGGSVAEQVSVDDSVPDVFEIIGADSAKGTVSIDGQRVRVSIDSLAPGESVRVTIRARVKSDAPPGTVVNTVTVSTITPGDDPSNNTSSVPVTIPAPAPPRALPRTGADPGGVALVALIGAGAIALSLLFRRRSVRR